MKYIQKTPTPAFFISDTNGLTSWSQYIASKKRILKKYILDNEQFGLCCYCEKDIIRDINASHIEHIKPKSLDINALTFDYSNLLVSCEGNHFNEIGDNRKNTCGHLKDDNFDEINFLNPTLINYISDYFILPKADYTIQTLNLNGNNDKLAEARKKAKDALIRNFATLPIDLRKKKMREFLQDESKEFITFFRYVFRYLR